jgi:hypothetical protein
MIRAIFGIAFIRIILAARDCHFLPLHNYQARESLREVIKLNGLSRCAELGVQDGLFAAELLRDNDVINQYHLVDVWQQLSNYVDLANVDNSVQHQKLTNTVERLRQFADKTVFHISTTLQAVRKISLLDFVYVDARHDYCSVLEDLKAYFPLMSKCSVMSGHDFLSAEEVRKLTRFQDWGLCPNGSRFEGAVKQAVLEFHSSLRQRTDVTVGVLHSTFETWPTWYFTIEKH